MAVVFIILDVSTKKEKLAGVVAQWHGHAVDPHCLGYCELFNHARFYEAHDVLEQLWLQDRHGPNGALYKGLIQLAGAFVHLQKNRLRPAAALFKLADANLKKYPSLHEHFNLRDAIKLIAHWLEKLEGSGDNANPLTATNHPKILLEP